MLFSVSQARRGQQQHRAVAHTPSTLELALFMRMLEIEKINMASKGYYLSIGATEATSGPSGNFLEVAMGFLE